ncbi:MAG: hypothetical protein AB1450_11560 [Pseudomonadota bacterium]
MPKPITYSDIAKALDRGLLTKEGLQEVIDGWKPKKRGPKEHLMHQATVLGVYELLRTETANLGIVRDAIMNADNGPSQSRYYEILDAAKKNWTPAPPFDPDNRANGERHRAIMLTCNHPNHYGYSYTVEIVLDDWLR